MKYVVAFLALLGMYQSNVYATVVFSQEINMYTNRLGGVASDESFTYSGTDYGGVYTYDNFSLDSDAYLSEATWTGFFRDGATYSEFSGDEANFTIQFATSGVSFPDPAFIDFAVTATVTPDRLLFSSSQTYSFHAIFDTPVLLQQDVEYWFSTAFVSTDDVSFFWESENNNLALGSSLAYWDESDEWRNRNYATNFALYAGDIGPQNSLDQGPFVVPLPPTWVLLLAGMVGLKSIRKHRV